MKYCDGMLSASAEEHKDMKQIDKLVAKTLGVTLEQSHLPLRLPVSEAFGL